jgi:esterase/lipase superfamily enzyme
VGTFSFTLNTSGNKTVTATDTVTSSITGTSGTVAVGAGAATHFAVSVPSSATAGVAFSGTVTALDQFNNLVTGYAGTVHFTSSDGQASLPADSTLSSGAGTFSFTLKTSGTRTVTATDTANSSITGTSGTVTVHAAAATHFAVSVPSAATAGVAFSGTVTALDQFNNTATGYTGTVQFTSSDGQAVLPANYTFTGGNAGVQSFSFTLKTSGNQTVTATDAASSITGTSGAVTVSAVAATHLVVSLPSSATAGVAFSGTVTAKDQFGNTATGYAGTVHFTSSDGAAILPADSTLTSGVGTFSFTLNTSGSKSVTATDTVTSSITGTSGAVTVSTGGATHFAVTAPASVTAGVGFSVTVTALDQFNNQVTGYAGTVHFTSSDGLASLPADSTLTSGSGTFSVTLKTSGHRTVTATDTVTSSITGTCPAVMVFPGAATHFVLNLPSSATAGVAFSGTVTAQDQFGNTATGYTGTVHFTSSDTGTGVILPANLTLSSGFGSFNDGFTLVTSGNQTVTATDTTTSSITGTSGAVTVSAAAATHLVVSLPSSATASVSFSGTVTAKDQFGNTATGYAGTVHFTSSDGAAVLPADSTLTTGVGTFSFTLNTSGSKTVTATDTMTSSITGTSGNVNVTVSVTSPVVQCPGIIGTNSASGDCGQTVSFAATSTGPATITYTIDGSTVITSPYFFPVGTNEVTSTATNSVGTNVCTFSVVVTNSEPPVAGAFAMAPQESTPESVPVAKILAVCESPRGGTLSITSVTSPTANGTVALGGGLLTYTPAAGYVGADTINYVLSDGCGPVTGTIAVTVTSTNAPSQNGLTIQMSSGSAILQFHGIPGTSYYIQQSSAMTGPWVDLSGTPVTANTLGLINYTVTSPTSPSYYRTSTQP